jgi:hypothetical protein
MRKQIAKACTDDVIDRFLQDREAGTADRPRLDLPELGPISIGLDTPIRVTRPRLHIVRADAKRFSLRCGDCTWTMSKRALPVLKTLSDHEPHTLRELLAKHGLSRMADAMLVLVQDMAKHRVIGVAT